MVKKSKKKTTNKEKSTIIKICSIFSGIALWAFAVGLVLSMIGYNPADESFNVSNSEQINNFMGRFGSYSSDFIVNSFGLAIFVFLIPVVVWGFMLIKHHKILEFKIRVFALILGIVSLSGIFYQTMAVALEKINLLGKFSHLLPQFLNRLFKGWKMEGYENIATFTLLFLVTLMSFNLATGITLKQWGMAIKKISLFLVDVVCGVYRFVTRLLNKEEVEQPILKTTKTKEKVRKEPVLSAAEDKEKSEDKPIKKEPAQVISIAGKQKDVNGYQYPDINLLKRPKEKLGLNISEKELNETARKLEAVLEEFGVRGQIVKIRPGPVVTLFELEPAQGTKNSRVISLADDIARSMSAISVRIAVVPGSNTIGIEIPNLKRETVWLRDLLEDVNFTDSKNALNVVLGKDIGGKNVYADLAKMPHLLVAGTTGSGKSVGVNAMILSLLYRMSPEECKFILIDPKMLEFSMYNGIPHLLTPVITDPAKAVLGLKWAVREMEERYRAMACLSVRNINGYNLKLKELRDKGEKPMRTIQVGFDPETGKPKYEQQMLDTTPLPYIVVVVDEMADLMLVAGKEVEAAIQRLA